MARFKIISLILLFTTIFSINSKPELTDVNTINSFLIERIHFHKRDKFFTNKELNKMSQIIRIAEQEYVIEPLLLIALISQESHFNKYATGKNKKKKKIVSVDYGLTQQNSKYIKQRFKKASKILDEYGVYYDIDDKYDTALNIMSGAMFLKEIKDSLNRKGQYTTFRMLANYNTGKAFPKGRRYRLAREYYLAIQKKQFFILTHAIDSDIALLR